MMYKLTKILLRSFSDKNFTGGYFWVKLCHVERLKARVNHFTVFSPSTLKTKLGCRTATVLLTENESGGPEGCLAEIQEISDLFLAQN